MRMKTTIEPFKIKVVEPIQMTTEAERAAILGEAAFNGCTVQARDVLIDLLTDSGTGAMRSLQCAAMMQGDESCAGESFYRFREALEGANRLRANAPPYLGHFTGEVCRASRR